jgi:hypothetical protein
MRASERSRQVEKTAVRGSGPRSESEFSLLEQIFKRLPRIAWARWGRGRGFLLARHPHFVGRTFIARVLLCHSLFHRLHALKPAARIEIHALLAGVQFESALRTLPFRRHSLQHRSALRATRDRARSRHVHRPRSERIVSLGRDAGFLTGSFPIFAGILISALPIFSIGHGRLLQLTAYCLATLPRTASLSPTPLMLLGVHFLRIDAGTGGPGCPAG